MKLLLISPPFCTPASPPYALANLYTFLKNNSNLEIELLDLNLEFHKLKYPQFKKFFQTLPENYEETSREYSKLTTKDYSENNKKVLHGEDPELLKELLTLIKKQKADYIAFSLVYSSQAFYTLALLKQLKNTIVGGPAVNDKVKQAATNYMANEVDLLKFLTKTTINMTTLNCNITLDFSKLPLKDYFVKTLVLPIRTTSACFYQQCTFCNHHGNRKYYEYSLEEIKQTIINSKAKQFFFIDDMISKKRLLQIAELLDPLNVKWMCQLRPTKDLDKETLTKLYRAGLRVVIWGVESANNRILKLMKKGTNKEDLQMVLQDSHEIGIKNVLYIMFGFPTETKEDFLETIDFLKDNTTIIDLISTSTFGLQKNTPIYKNPQQFLITKIEEHSRTILEPKITYQIKEGLTQEEAELLKKHHKLTLERINKYPKQMNLFREHLLNVS
ncbi:hypothetical protein COY27_04970 [Candidatus Woesearchaeota archaeon CG_4_10_14_0_2_um_filter_33_13]|nr:MAG: hypothetical protein COY27_04970 [Candidatus Woesearchaeota archaeon CG_4_10_14_0_2_um_filter_33_13]